VPDPFLTVFLASTDFLPSKFKVDAFQQGFYNRFIFVPAVRKKTKPLRQGLTKEEKANAQELLQYLDALKTCNLLYYLCLCEEANQLYSKFEEEIEIEIEKGNLGIKEGYYGGVPNFVIRIACLFRLNRMSVKDIEDLEREHSPLLFVSERDMSLAIKFGRLIWMWFERMMILRTEYGAKPEEVKTDEDYEAIVLNVFRNAGVRELPQNYIRVHSKIPTKRLEDILEMVACRTIKESTGGRRAIVWRLNEDVVT